MDDYILYLLHEVKLYLKFEAGHMLYPWDKSHLQLGPTNREVPTLTPRINSMKSKG